MRRLGTSATQFYRLLDQTNYKKSFGQLLSLLHVLDCDVELVVKERLPQAREVYLSSLLLHILHNMAVQAAVPQAVMDWRV